MVKLSAIICVQNQDALLSACLRKLSFCDEIVVVADRCTDRSQEVARRQGAVVVDGIFPLESQRKAAAAGACTGDWILELEVDEIVDPALAWEIRAVLQMRAPGDTFEIPIDNYIGETLVRDGWTGELSRRSDVRLYRRDAKAWEPGRIGASTVLTGAPGGSLTGRLRKVIGPDLGALVQRMDRVSALQAEDMADAGAIPGFGRSLLATFGVFTRALVSRGGWREGRIGLLVAVLAGLTRILAPMRAQALLQAREAAQLAREQNARRREAVGF